MVLGEPSGRSRVVRGDVHMARAVPLMGAQQNRTLVPEDPRETAPKASGGRETRPVLGLATRSACLGGDTCG